MKLKEKWLEILGITVVFAICFYSIFASFIITNFREDEIEDNTWDKIQYELGSYATFFENNFYDYRIKYLEPKKPQSKLVYVDLDDETLQKLGTWPLPRTTWAKLLDKLSIYGAKVVAFDVLFPEKSLSCSQKSPDDEFAAAIKRFQKNDDSHVVLAYTSTHEYHSQIYEQAPESLMMSLLSSSGKDNLTPMYVDRSTYPIEILNNAEPSYGFINMREDPDGVFRNYQLVSNIITDNDPTYYPSLALKTYELLSQKEFSLELIQNAGSLLTYDKTTLDTNQHGETKIRWHGSSKMFGSIPIWKVLEQANNDTEMHDIFKNKAVFIGSSATGAHDLRNTPVDAQMPGVFAHINMFQMLDTKFFYKAKGDSLKYSVLIMVVTMTILLSIMYLGNAVFDLITMIVLVSGVLYLDHIIFLPAGYEIRLFFSVFCIFFSYIWLTFSNFNKTSQEKKQIKGAFSRYVAPSIVNDMLANPDKLKVGGDRKNITCLFSDVRDFTSISEKLTANELAKCLNRYMGEMTDIVFETEGTLDKYIGDAIVAFWGAPIDIGDHVNKALSASVKMLDVLPSINKEFKEQGYPEFKIGLGLNSGECNVGNMGSDMIFAYTALGDNMNLGARLESLCKHYGAQILISEFTYEKMDKEKFRARKIDYVKVKGKEKGVGVYEVLYSYHRMMIDQESFNQFNTAYKMYENRQFKEGLEILGTILDKHPEDEPSKKIYLRCEEFIKNPPAENIDHTLITMTSK
ncbi:MAG: adenylate/guanylate cyclase domain-containing protein [Bacteriovoracaceae bacterium]|jgi:adenylate cyclase|nr:adenylate/guanylate cyclase domain-containing protein [Bacteriovoracaceae bacterium]